MMIDDLALARAIHVLALVHWIGGVAVVTTIVLPHARALPNAKDAVASFEAFELRFASQARISILLVGLSGAYMLTKLGAWNRFQYASFWWLDLMIAVWMLSRSWSTCSNRSWFIVSFTNLLCATRIAPSRWRQDFTR